jgi:hypothetical protein
MIETDPLSLVFIACFVFASAFILATTVLGATHLHGVHLGHTGHVHLGGHVSGHTAGHTHVGGHAATTHVATGHAGHNGHLPARVAVSHQQTATQADASSGPSFVGQLLGTLNLNAILGFLFTFGLLGYLLHNATHAGAVVTVILAVICGAGGATALNTLMIRLFGAETGRLGADSSAMEGRVATVSIPIRADGVGEIIFMGENGTRRSLGARSSDGEAIDRDADVVILGYHNGMAEVQSWDRFIAATHMELDALAPPGE